MLWRLAPFHLHNRIKTILKIFYCFIFVICLVFFIGAIWWWYIVCCPPCPDPETIFKTACKAWSTNCKSDGKSNVNYTVPPALIPDTRCIDGILGEIDGKVTMDEVCKYAGYTDYQKCVQACGC
ncbi:MAG: hypothetical protein QXQ77_03195 [Candidatus Aenigmatarchaeota archaeon]